MAKAAELKISGIKCDNSKCDYQDMSVRFEDYKDWVNKPCPKCGANLLTEIDFINVTMMMTAIESVNKQYPDGIKDEETISASVQMNGTGRIEIAMNDEDKKIIIAPPKDSSTHHKIKSNLKLSDMK